MVFPVYKRPVELSAFNLPVLSVSSYIEILFVGIKYRGLSENKSFEER